MVNLPYLTQDLFWVGDSKKKLSGFSEEIRSEMGFSLWLIQNGETPQNSYPLKGLGSGVREIKSDYMTDTYRTVYIAKLKRGVYVLDSFQKKSKKGKGLPKHITDRIKKRLIKAKEFDKGA